MAAEETIVNCPACEGSGANPVLGLDDKPLDGPCDVCGGAGTWQPTLRAIVVLEADPRAIDAWFDEMSDDGAQPPAPAVYFAERVQELIDDEFSVATMFSPIHIRPEASDA